MSKTIMVAAAAVALIGGGVGFYLFFTPGPEAEAAETAAPEPGVVEFEPFLTNLASGGGHKARLQVTLAITPKELADSILSNALLNARIRDQILSNLSSKSYQELSEPAGKQALRREIQTSVGAILDGEVQETLFVDFVLQ